MIKKKNKKSLFKRILAFTGALMCAFAFCFGLVKIVDNHNDTLEVSADEVIVNGYEFEGSGLFSLGSTFIKSNDWYFSNGTLDLLKITFNFSSINGINVDHVGFNVALGGSNTLFFSFSSFPNEPWGGVFPCLLYNYNGTDVFFIVNYQFEPVDENYDNPTFKKPIGFNYYSNEFNGTIYFTVEYFDADNNLFLLSWSADGVTTSFPFSTDLVMERRTYFFDDAFDLSENEYYNQGYQVGHSDGYNYGYNVGSSSGYSDGYKAGEIFGYNKGHQEGSEDSNQYTFLSLVSSVIDAPMMYFTSLFNFELLGVNLQGFLMALFTLCVIVTIVKLCLGG